MNTITQSRHGDVLDGGTPRPCRDCPALIIWVQTPARPGKPSRKMPVNADTDESHFTTCPAANTRRRQPAGGARREPLGRSTTPPQRQPPAPAAHVAEGVGPVVTGRVVRFCPDEMGRVVLARDEEEAILRALGGHVAIVVLDEGQKLKAGDRVKLRRLS